MLSLNKGHPQTVSTVKLCDEINSSYDVYHKKYADDFHRTVAKKCSKWGVHCLFTSLKFDSKIIAEKAPESSRHVLYSGKLLRGFKVWRFGEFVSELPYLKLPIILIYYTIHITGNIRCENEWHNRFTTRMLRTGNMRLRTGHMWLISLEGHGQQQ